MKRMDGMIRSEVFKQLNKFTYGLETEQGDERTMRWEVFKKLIKFTYPLETDEEDGWDDQKRGLQTID